jgi:hypothetical protein
MISNASTLQHSLHAGILIGDSVTIATTHGQQITGRATIIVRGSHVVLNTGGRYGTTAIATPDNLISVKKGR